MCQRRWIMGVILISTGPSALAGTGSKGGALIGLELSTNRDPCLQLNVIITCFHRQRFQPTIDYFN
ncbi:hypothetical protein HID58_053945 [Brassica napus]|uniref:Secreted protein n=1 Tax=Brassica napus TaxID=3708 RepID=A0ABQ8AHF6_BRANA|nr:hypothetical protein HID58_053945 [Brassica napus]